MANGMEFYYIFLIFINADNKSRINLNRIFATNFYGYFFSE